MDDPSDLLAAAKRPAEPLPRRAVHPRVLQLPLGPGELAWTLLVWDDPGGAPALHAALRPLVEATLSAELSEPYGLPDETTPVALRLLAFADVPGFEQAVRAFGLEAAPHDEAFEEALRNARGEAGRVGREPPDEPTSRWEVRLRTLAGTRELEDALRQTVGEEAFGARPGALFAALNQVLHARGETPLPPRLSSLDALEARLGTQETGVVRWIPPRLFQALCDAVAVVATKELGREVQWAPSEIEDDGLARPPLVRVAGPRGAWMHLPLGQHLLRWCVMPRHRGEEVPPLSAWLRDELA